MSVIAWFRQSGFQWTLTLGREAIHEVGDL